MGLKLKGDVMSLKSELQMLDLIKDLIHRVAELETTVIGLESRIRLVEDDDGEE